MEQNLLLLLVCLPFIGSLAVLTLSPRARDAVTWVSAAVNALGVVILYVLRPYVLDGVILRNRIRWLPELGLDFTLRLDGFAWFMLLLVFGIGLLVVIYARYYLTTKDPVPRFFSYLLAFTGAMTGMLVSGNLIMLVVFWELTSVFSFLLIGFWYHNATARDGARMALIVTGGGGLCLLVGALILGHIVGSYDLDWVLASGDLVRAHPLYRVVLILILIGAFTKSAQFPFHFWLPNAMAASTPVSSYLHSATMVKAGVFLLIRFSPVLGGTPEWFWIVGGVGMITLLIGAVTALFRHDLKGLLAYSTISHLGLITALAGIGSPLAIVAAIFHIGNHAVFKASLFMAAGIIDHETGTRDMRRLSGLYKLMPITGTLAIVAAAAMAGVPLLNGFLSKEMFFAEAAEWHNGSLLDDAMPYIATIAGAFAVAYSLRFIHAVFFGPAPIDLPKVPHEPPALMRRPVELLVLICVVVGIFPAATIGPYLYSAAVSVLGRDLPYYSLSLWHGFNLPLVMSILAIVVGVAIYAVLARRLPEGPEGAPFFHRLSGEDMFDRTVLALTWKWPRMIIRYIGTERLQPQLRWLVGIALGLVGLTLWHRFPFAPQLPAEPPSLAFAMIWVVGGACAIAAAHQAKYHRFAALVLLGGAGVVTCMTFAWLAAPDLAVTQLVVEIVTTVLLLLGLRWLPKRQQEIRVDVNVTDRARRWRDFGLAVICGAGIAAIAYTIMTAGTDRPIADWFLEHAYSEGGGTNVVNVILVDFRAFDTFGEITVLGVVGLTVFALLRRFRPSQESVELPEQQRFQSRIDRDSEEREEEQTIRDYLYVPSVIMHWMFPPIIVLSIYLFLRGHDLPGGGFAGGVVMAIGFLLQYLAANARWVEDQLTVLPVRWIATGMLIAVATGVGAWLFGYPFLTAHARYVHVPWIGDVPAATALLFDLGVFSVVVGATLLILIAIAHQSIRSSRKQREPEDKDPKEAV
ncbi:cation:proton antiporter [Haematobacter missouriensis]|uniref:Monovalent cation/H+ antiporter subunit A n=1 Tax=Haematobacter missouriensis TaxID=366616 RepID=A0ABX3ZTF2_9RHOB|nr:monovalent cation/H+ antiporter subunit A [Haematobacter missouriensis]KFI33277.1 cation:proton antiporter [Haematobacter missouriensis]OWJ75782.1 monovalent cation/H+ antiporter subunit A [Haematobacter missouriensis]